MRRREQALERPRDARGRFLPLNERPRPPERPPNQFERNLMEFRQNLINRRRRVS